MTPTTPHADATPESALRRGWRRFSRSHLRTLAGAALGVAVAAGYAYFVGCRTGTCPLTSSVWTASAYGAIVGAFAAWPARRPG
jgi:hypothetical protein